MAAFIQAAIPFCPSLAAGPTCPARLRALRMTSGEGTPSSSAGEAVAAVKCAGCGRAGGPVGGCNADGRVAGGLGAVFAWWPIKAYRPCPELIKAKKTYRRAGQSLDEIAFGRKGTGDEKSITERLTGK